MREDRKVSGRTRLEVATAARLDQRGTTPAFLHVAATTAAAMQAHDGDALVFLPGAREIDDVAGRLRSPGTVPGGTEVMALHGRLPPAEQDPALREGRRRRVVVTSAVAESSLTVPGVRIVVDAGLARVPRTDHNRGLPGLGTRSVSRAGAEQRAGCAGRVGPGQVYRCWSQADAVRLEAHPAPEIHTADLTAAMLELARWGTPVSSDADRRVAVLCTQVDTPMDLRKETAMSVTVGVREFRQDLADYIDQDEPVTVTRHGRTVGLFIPVHQDRKAEIAAYAEAAKKASALLERLGMTEDEFMAEFEAMRKSRRRDEREAASAS